MPDDLGLRKQLVAVTMVAVVMLIEDASRRFAPDARVVFDQLARAPQIPERVNYKSAATVDKPRIAPTQPAVRLQTSVNVFCDLLQSHLLLTSKPNALQIAQPRRNILQWRVRLLFDKIPFDAYLPGFTQHGRNINLSGAQRHAPIIGRIAGQISLFAFAHVFEVHQGESLRVLPHQRYRVLPAVKSPEDVQLETYELRPQFRRQKVEQCSVSVGMKFVAVNVVSERNSGCLQFFSRAVEDPDPLPRSLFGKWGLVRNPGAHHVPNSERLRIADHFPNIVAQ